MKTLLPNFAPLTLFQPFILTLTFLIIDSRALHNEAFLEQGSHRHIHYKLATEKKIERNDCRRRFNRSKFYVELMHAITECDYFKPAAGVPAERIIHYPSISP